MYIADETALFPKGKIILSFFFLFVCCSLVVSKGSKTYKSYFGVEYCGTTFWFLNFMQCVFVIIFEFILYGYLKRKN